MFDMKKKLASLAIAGSVFGATAVGVGAAPPETKQQGGAAGLVAAVVQIATDDVQVGLVNVNNSLNNLTALNNVLNNSPILSNNDIDVVDVIDIDDIVITVVDGDVIVIVNDVLNGTQVGILNNFLNNVLNYSLNDLDALIGIAVLSDGTLVLINGQ